MSLLDIYSKKKKKSPQRDVYETIYSNLFVIAKTGNKPKTRDQGLRMIIRDIKGHQKSVHD